VRYTDLAEDLVQETLLAAIEDRHRFEARSSLRTWLVGILKHKLLDYRRRSARRAARAQPPPKRASDEEVEAWTESQFSRRGKWKIPPAQWGDDPRSILESDEFRVILVRCLEKLPIRAADALMLTERQGLNAQRLGNFLGISATNVGVLLYRARSAMRRCLEVHWFGRKRAGESHVV
jgi:RNA polymerase sigma-70 factor (ECF subfamily)